MEEIVRALRRYIAERPDAADSIDGVHRWWLLPRLHEEPLELVELAVAYLVHEGVLRAIVQEDGRVIYSSGRKPPARDRDGD